MEAPSGGSAKAGPLGPDSLLKIYNLQSKTGNPPEGRDYEGELRI